MNRNLATYISAMLSLVIVALCFVMFWMQIEGLFLPINMLLLSLPPSWILLKDVYVVDSTARKILYSDQEDIFFCLRGVLFSSIKTLCLKFVIVMCFLLTMAFFLVPEDGVFKGDDYVLWGWSATQALFVLLLDRLLPLNEK